MKTLAFCSFKGGTGKTTLSLNIGNNLSQISSKRVLLVDLDPQANLTTSLGIQTSGNCDLHSVLKGENNILEAIHHTKVDNLDIIPSSVLMEDFRGLQQANNLVLTHLKDALYQINDQYDVCILDTPPSLGILTYEAFLASHYLIVCLTPEPFSILGLQKIKEFSQSLEKDVDVLGITFSFWDERNSTNSMYMDIIESVYPNKIFHSKIRRDVNVSRSLLKETALINVYPNSRASQDLLNLTKEIENKLFKTN